MTAWRHTRPRVAVATIVRGRQDHLRNLLRGLAVQQRPADQVVVAVMGGPDPSAVVAEVGLPTTLVDASDERTPLPLARARNLARGAAMDADVLVLLDVDVIPHPRLVADYVALVTDQPGVWSGRVDYLPAMDRLAEPDPDMLDALGTPHPARRPPPTDTRLPAPEMFWSLSFAADRGSWDRLGGFDERYVGYGAEDTDFGLRAHRAGVWLGWTRRARGWHQHHETQVPPRQHLGDIVANARTFRATWGRWPMEGWLRAFTEEGLVSWDPDGDLLELTTPTLAG